MKKCLYISLFLISFLIIIIGNPAKVNASMDYMYTHNETIYNSKNGLLTSATNGICQTTDGYIWIAQYVGLTKYNGFRFETIKSVIIEGEKISFEEIKCIASDDNNNLYIGTMTNGLIKYSNNEYTKIKSSMGSYINNIEVTDDIVFVGTSKGAFFIKDGEIEEIEESKEYDIQSISAMNGSIYIVDSNNKTYQISKKSNQVTITHLETLEKVKTLYAYNNILYCGTKNGELILFNGENILKNVKICTHAITSLTSRNDILYIGTDSGVFTFNGDTFDSIDGLSITDNITDIIFDYDGQMWISSSNGVSKFHKNLIENLFHRYQLSTNIVNTTEFYDGYLYVGTAKGLICFDEENQTLVNNVLTTTLDGIRIRDLEVYQNKLYVATYNSADYDIVIYDGTNISEIKASDMVEDFDSEKWVH